MFEGLCARKHPTFSGETRLRSFIVKDRQSFVEALMNRVQEGLSTPAWLTKFTV
jgi:hypothetical protein